MADLEPIEYGETTDLPFVLTDDATPTPAPYVLTDKRVSFSISRHYGSDPIVVKTSEDATEITKVDEGEADETNVTVHLVAGDFADLPAGAYRYSLWVDAAGTEIVMRKGRLVVEGTVARTA